MPITIKQKKYLDIHIQYRKIQMNATEKDL